jgi:peroxin-7
MQNKRFKTDGFQGYACEFSPFSSDILAIASAANYGIVGNGRLWIVHTASGTIERMYIFSK